MCRNKNSGWKAIPVYPAYSCYAITHGFTSSLIKSVDKSQAHTQTQIFKMNNISIFPLLAVLFSWGERFSLGVCTLFITKPAAGYRLWSNLNALAVAYSPSIYCGACPFKTENDAENGALFLFDINSPEDSTKTKWEGTNISPGWAGQKNIQWDKKPSINPCEKAALA